MALGLKPISHAPLAPPKLIIDRLNSEMKEELGALAPRSGTECRKFLSNTCEHCLEVVCAQIDSYFLLMFRENYKP